MLHNTLWNVSHNIYIKIKGGKKNPTAFPVNRDHPVYSWSRASEDEMAGWHHQCNGCELGQTLGDGWRTRRPGMLQPMGLQRAGHDWETEQQQQSL